MGRYHCDRYRIAIGSHNRCYRLQAMKAYYVGLLMLALLISSATLYGVAAADNDTPCLTKEQARAKYPGQYLYWRTEHHCWYGRPGRGRVATFAHGSRVVHPRVKIVRWNDYNEIDAAADRETYFNPGEPLPIWRLAPIPQSKFKPWDERIGM